MAKPKFYLKNPKAKDETLIYLFYSRDGQRIKLSTGETIHPKNWNNEEQEARKNFQGHTDLNNLLNKYKEGIKSIYQKAISEGIPPTQDYVRAQFVKLLFKDKAGDSKKGIFDYIEEYIEDNATNLKPNSLKKFRTLSNHLSKFQAEKKYKVTFDTIDLVFYDKFLSFLIKDLGHLNSSVGTAIKKLKTFLRWATERGYNTNMAFTNKKFKVFHPETDIIYLTDKELMSLYEFDFGNRKVLENMRDVFCFACFTGLRYSDVEQLRKAHIKGNEIHITTIKTKDKLIIPLIQYATAILKKHDYKLPIITNQKSNHYLKEMAKVVGIDEEIIIMKSKGVEELEFKGAKHEFISFHTARRTYITLSLEKGMRPEVVMSITGHKNWATFKKYIKLIPAVKVYEMNKAWNPEVVLKAVS